MAMGTWKQPRNQIFSALSIDTGVLGGEIVQRIIEKKERKLAIQISTITGAQVCDVSIW